MGTEETDIFTWALYRVGAELSCCSGYLLSQILGKAGCQILVSDKSSDRTIYGNAGIFLLGSCTVLSFCRRQGRKDVLERAMVHSHRKKKAGRQLERSNSYTLVQSCKIVNGSQQLTQYELLRFPIFPSQRQFHHRTHLTGAD